MKKYRIKDIAELASVSVGTVDRILHNRGDVSPETRKKIEDVLEKINYIKKIHSKTPNTKRPIRILVIMPQHGTGEYWYQIKNGIEKAQTHYGIFNIKITYLYYNQFDIFSCRKCYKEAIAYKKDAVIIGPSFYDETIIFANQLTLQKIPYVFVDAYVNNTEPLAFYSPQNAQCGRAQARLLTSSMDKRKSIVLLLAKRIGDETSISSIERQQGFMAYIKENSINVKIINALYNKFDPLDNRNLLDEIFSNNDIGAAAIFNSRAYIISSYLREKGIKDIKLVGFGANKNNITDLKDGYISFLIEERPEDQGYMSVKSIIEYIQYDKKPITTNYTPIDIIIKETADYYIEANSVFP